MRLDGQGAGRDALFLTGLSAVSQVLSFFYRVGLSRLVGAQVMGLYQLVMPVYSLLLALTATGLTAAVSNLSARYLAVGNSRGVAGTVRLSLLLFGGLLVPLGSLTVLLSDPVSVYLLGDARTRLGLVLLVPCVALTGVENLHKHFFYGIGRVRAPAVVELLEQFVRTGSVLGLLAVFLPQGPERTVGLIVTGMVVCEVFSAGVLVGLYRRQLARMGLRGPGERTGRLGARLGAIAAPVSLTALLGNGMNAVSSAMVPKWLVASGLERGEAMAAFGVVCGMTLPMLSVPMLFLGAVNLILVPRVARSCALGRMDRVRRDVGRALERVCALLLPGMALLTVVAEPLGGLLFGQSRTGEHLLPLALGLTCSAIHSVLGGALNGVERQGTAAAIALVCDVVQLAVTALAMGRWGLGMGGFAAGLCVSCVLGLVLALGAVRRYTGYVPELWRTLIAPLCATLLSAQTARVFLGVLTRAGASPWGRVGGTVALGGAVYLAALCAMGVEELFFSPGRKKSR